jgi:hypothetical protein
MDEGIQPVKVKPAKTGPVKTRPVLMTVLCLFSFVFFAIMAVLFFAGIFWSDWITSVTNQYAPPGLYALSTIRLIFTGGFLLHALALSGSILLWNLRKEGYYLLALSCILIASFQLIQPQIAVTTTAVYILLLLMFGIFFRRLH